MPGEEPFASVNVLHKSGGGGATQSASIALPPELDFHDHHESVDRVSVIVDDGTSYLVVGNVESARSYAVSETDYGSFKTSIHAPALRLIGVDIGDRINAYDGERIRLEVVEEPVNSSVWCGHCGRGPYKTENRAKFHVFSVHNCSSPVLLDHRPAESEIQGVSADA